MAKLGGFILLTATCNSTVQWEGIFAFPWQQWLRCKMLRCTYIVYLAFYVKYYVFRIIQIISRTISYFPIYGVSYRTVNAVQGVNRIVST